MRSRERQEVPEQQVTVTNISLHPPPDYFLFRISVITDSNMDYLKPHVKKQEKGQFMQLTDFL
jgi:hypothetical protein